MPEESHTRSYTGPTLASMILAERRVIPYREIPEKHSDYVFKPYDEFVDAVEALFGKHELSAELELELAGIAIRGWNQMADEEREVVEKGISKLRKRIKNPRTGEIFERKVNDHDLIPRLIDAYEIGHRVPIPSLEVISEPAPA
jgi:hypothetical protein